jgi:S1-C subfamily serine protease
MLLIGSANTQAQDKGDEHDPLAAAEAYQQKLFEKIAPSVIFISQGDSIGSGFFVNESGLALTNKHVVGDAKSVKVVLNDGRSLSAKVVERAKGKTDLALIQVDVNSVDPLSLTGFDELRVGSWVGSVGHGVGGVWTFTRGMVSNIYPSEKSRPIFQTQIPLNPGASGGPVFDRKGRVVGVVTTGIIESNSVNFAIRSDVALGSLKKLSEQCHCLTITAPEGVPIFVNGKMMGKGPEVIVQVSEGEHEVFAVVKGKMNKRKVEFPKTKAVSLD